MCTYVVKKPSLCFCTKKFTDFELQVETDAVSSNPIPEKLYNFNHVLALCHEISERNQFDAQLAAG